MASPWTMLPCEVTKIAGAARVTNATNFDTNGGVARQGGRIRAGAGLRVAIDHHAAAAIVDRRQSVVQLNHVYARARDIERDQVISRVKVGALNGRAERALARRGSADAIAGTASGSSATV